MQGKIIALAIASGLALTTVTPAFATLSAPYGWYLEANAGSSNLTNKTYSSGSASSSGVGGNADLGYKFMPFVAAEIGYTQYANTIIRSYGTKVATDRHLSYDLAIKGILPIADSGFEAFAKVGAAHIASKLTINSPSGASAIGISRNSHTTTGLYFAIGAQYYVMPELAFNVQWARAVGNSSTGTESLLSGGLSFIFD
jgi:hypothetical protein